jgi:pyruvate kinase
MRDTRFDLVSAGSAAAEAAIMVDLAWEGAVQAELRRAKIICTIGPASNSEAAMRDLMRLGMDVARLNFSHGTHNEHARNIARLRRAAKKEQRTISILQDLEGPKIRTGRLKGHSPIQLAAGSRVTLTPRQLPGTDEIISTNFPGLASEVGAGSTILLSDGRIELRVEAILGDDVECEVINGGTLGEQQGINLAGTILGLPSLTEKDRRDLEFGLKHGVDLVALSFVRSAADVHAVRDLIRDLDGSVQVVAKLEKAQAIDDLDEILEAADAVMVARGDLGVELPPEKVPVIQKQVIRRAAELRKPVITATQMLESMVENPRPTRAEASDVANAIFDGSDAVMLSAETAIGKYPREAVAIMTRIITEAERNVEPADTCRRRNHRRLSIAETISESIAHAAEDLDISAIAVFTESGNTARQISKYRAKSETFAFSQSQTVCNRMNLLWGIRPVWHRQARSAEHMVDIAERELLRRAKVRAGDVIGVVAGTRLVSGSTNFMRLHVVRDNASGTRARRKKRNRR